MSQGMSNVRVEGASDIRELKVLGDWAYLRNYLDISISFRRRRISERLLVEVMTLIEERGPGRRGWGACLARALVGRAD
jgi:hypothetical protein